MNRLNPILMIVLALMMLSPAQAMVALGADQTDVCPLFAEQDKGDGTTDENEEEEPDCD